MTRQSLVVVVSVNGVPDHFTFLKYTNGDWSEAVHRMRRSQEDG